MTESLAGAGGRPIIVVSIFGVPGTGGAFIAGLDAGNLRQALKPAAHGG